VLGVDNTRQIRYSKDDPRHIRWRENTTSEGHPNATISNEAALDALHRVLGSQAFANAARLRELLDFVVQRTLDSDLGRLKEQEVGAAVYGRELSYDPHTDPVVRVAARQLRFKLTDYYAGEGQADPVRISLPKGGYVAVFSAGEALAGPAVPETPAPRKMRPFSAAVAGLAALIIAVAAGVWLVAGRSPTPRIRSIVVLPFQNLSGDPAYDYVSDGLTEELTGALVRIPNLRVVARTSAYQFKGKGEDIRIIGQKLNVDAVLEGSVLRAGSRLRVAAQLNRTSDGYHVWAERYDRDLQDAVSLQDEIARAVSFHLETTGSAAPSPPRRTENVEAHNSYLMGRYLFNQRTETGMRKSIAYFQKAVALDPSYAAAYASLASTWMVLLGNDYARPAEAAPQIRDFATRAATLDPTLGEPHAALGLLSFEYDWNWPMARRELRRAIDLTPGDELCHHFYAVALMWEGASPEAIVELQKAVELDPLAPAGKAALILFYAYARQPDRAIQESRGVLDAFPNFFLAHAALGAAYEQKRMYAEAIAQFEREMALSPGDPDAPTRAAHAYAAAGNRAKALPLLAKLLHPAAGIYVPPSDLAMVYAGLGDKRHCLEWLGRGLDERAPGMIEIRMDPAFDWLRGDPDFQTLISRVGLWNAPGAR
jgi:TolB-like protein/Flp pilus assembly protein TadD